MGLKTILDRLAGRNRLTLGNSLINRHCSEFEVNNWAVSRFVVERLVPVVGLAPFPLNEQMLMVAAVCRLQPTHIFEWGTNIGKSARIFHETCKELGLATEIHSVDLPDEVTHVEHPRSKRGRLVRHIPQVSLHLGDGLETSLAILARSDKANRPLFFLDGDHGYESVKRELAGIAAAAPHAHILLHDTFFQSPDSGYNIGPYRALAELLETDRRFRVISQDLGLPGMTLLWQPGQEGVR